MKVFLSWSGSVSRRVALALRDWLPNVIQAIDPWMSSEDIEKGARWSADVASELVATKAGIVCVTPDNRDAPWLNFEAGALSKTVDKEMVCPYLFRLKPSDLTGPLVQFQAAEANKADTQRLVATLNRATEKPISEGKLVEAFSLWWGKLESKLSEITTVAPPESTKRTSEDMLEEVLGLVREQSRATEVTYKTIQEMRLTGRVNSPTYGPGLRELMTMSMENTLNGVGSLRRIGEDTIPSEKPKGGGLRQAVERVALKPLT